MSPKITVVTCTKNREKFLPRCLLSVKNQTYTNIEHIIIDGYSTDNSVSLIRKYIENNPGKDIKFFQYKPKGIPNALNMGVKHASGDIVHFLHSDDFYFDRNTLKKVASYFVENPGLKWLIGNGVFMYEDKIFTLPLAKILKVNTKALISTYNLIPHENTFVTLGFIKKYGPFEENHKITIEYPMWLRAIKKENPLVVDDNFTVFIIHKDSMSSNILNYPTSLYEIFQSWKETKSIPLLGDYEHLPIYKSIKVYLNTLRDYINQI